ncbi:GNAT family N-acetyltransferase [Motilibacter aurantiacus]|uniref:GNAT family N-acetyltransferase n=1 Tax=Motilibacter aurantiacus TaxID=2714955 RepID=UPI002F2B228F
MADVRLTPVVRPAGPDDSRALWEWRNDPTTRAMSAQTDEVAWEAHQAWYARALDDPRRRLLVAELDGERVGMVRFDDAGEGHWVVSINLAPAARGRGLAAPVLRAGEEWLRSSGTAELLIAEVRDTNAASWRTFERAGYVQAAGAEDGWRRYELRPGPGSRR